MKWLSLLVVGVAGIGLLGCGPEETALSCPDPSDGEVDEGCGVWVSASLGSDDNPGTRAKPMASLTAAAAKAYEKELDVYACGEVWTEPLVLPRDVSLFGGFDCKNGWAHGGLAHRARIETGPGKIPLKTSGEAGQMDVFDFDIWAADAIEPGGSSIAVIIADPGGLHFRRCSIVGGDAQDGLDAELLEDAAAAGAQGNPGVDACTTSEGPGGEATETACGADGSSKGGKGGSGGPTVAGDGEAGLPGPSGEKDPENLADGDGGKGQSGAEACTPGEPGADGLDGDPAEQGPFPERMGRVSIDGFEGMNGGDGKPGAPGHGGGGGGASRGAAAVCGAATPGGAGGGSGGAGGCGGKGGKGGQAGGSSFAVVVLGQPQALAMEWCELWVGRGGNGGDGAPGQPGGSGGASGGGGAAQDTLQPGCQGGKGGAGGKGGGGGGGHAGHAAYIAFRSYAFGDNYPGTTFGGITYGGIGGSGGAALAPDGDLGQGTRPDQGIRSIGFQQ